MDDERPGQGGSPMYPLKRFKVRSYEMGLYFRGGEFRGLLGEGTYWFLDPLDRVDGRDRLAADSAVRPREARPDRQVGRAEGPRPGHRPEGRPARPGLDRRPVQRHSAAGSVRLLDGPPRCPRRDRRRPPAAVRARGPAAHHALGLGRRIARDLSRSAAAAWASCSSTAPMSTRCRRARTRSGGAWPTHGSSRSTCARRRSTSAARRS